MRKKMKYKSAYITILAITAILSLSTLFGIYKIINNFWLMTSLENEKARITSCEGKYTNSGSGKGSIGGGGGRKRVYTPIASTLSGKRITGTVFSSYNSCRENVGEDVIVLINPSLPNGGHINTFTQFWLKYVALVFGTLIANLVFMYPSIIAIKKMQSA